MIVSERDNQPVFIGYVGENNSRPVSFYVGDIIAKYPDAVFSLIHKRKGDPDGYPVSSEYWTVEGNTLTWRPQSGDLAEEGIGELQIKASKDGDIIKTKRYKTDTHGSLGVSADPPAPWESWIEQVEDAASAAEEAASAAEEAAVHQPIIDENGYWNTWDQETGEYVATETKAQGEAPIDDTTPAANKVYSSNKIEAELTPVKNALTTLESDTENNFANLVSVIEGAEIIHPIFHENYFANYLSKTITSFVGCNVAEIDVSKVGKFKYNYTINVPDYRGLYFVDKNGNAMETSYQTLTGPQDIEVPAGAVKCFASVSYVEQIVVYEVVSEQPDEVFKAHATFTDKDNSGGIKYKWSDDNSQITISGTRTGNSFDNMVSSYDAMPSWLEKGKKYSFVFNPTNKNIMFSIMIYENGTNTKTKDINETQIWQIPESATGVILRLRVEGANTVVNETVACPEIYTVPVVKSIATQVSELNDAAYGNATNPLAYIRRDAGLLSVFHKVGCIGDSLASGASAYKEGGVTHYTDNNDFSWGQCLARLTGNTYYNFSAGGLSTRSWLASQKATDCFDGNHTCDAYFIGLGQNDKNNSIPVGTTADINLSDYTQNADTYCGNMGKIIQRLQILQPKAPIFVFIDPLPPSGDQAYNNAIPGIVGLFDNVWIIDLKTYGYPLFANSYEIIGSQARSGHYSAVGYQEIAHVIATYTDWIIRHNLSDFSQVEFIGTNYEWTT